MRVLVCGGRDYQDYEYFCAVMDKLHEKHGVTEIVQGGANGADKMAACWAKAKGIPMTEVKADWNQYGKAAGHIRNGEMLKLNPEMVIAFPGGRGTANMFQQACKAGVTAFQLKGRGHNENDRIQNPTS
jgi:hypothetical protein